MAETYNTNLINVSACYLRLLNVPITVTTLRQQLQENPFYPSLYSMSNVLERFHLDTTAFKTDKENFDKLQPPFVAYMSGQNTGRDFGLVTSITENQVKYIAENKKPQSITKEAFLKNWQRIMLMAEADEKSGEKDFLANRKKERLNTNKTMALIASSLLIFGITLFFFLHPLKMMSAALLQGIYWLLVKNMIPCKRTSAG